MQTRFCLCTCVRLGCLSDGIAAVTVELALIFLSAPPHFFFLYRFSLVGAVESFCYTKRWTDIIRWFFFHSLHFMHCVRSSFSNILPEFVCGMLLCYDPYFFRLPSMSTITYLLQTMTRHRDATDTYETNIHSRWYRISRAVVFAAYISIWTVLVRQTDMRHLFLWWGSI